MVWPVQRDDPIRMILIWANELCVIAIQFHMESGIASPIYGSIPSSTDNEGAETPPTEIIRVNPNEMIVGVFGQYSKVLNSLGITPGVVKSSEKVSGNKRKHSAGSSTLGESDA